MAEGDGEKRALEQQLERALTARVQHFKDQADSLTLESVRRLLEKDLGFEKFALDAHKRFIRHYLEKKMESADDGNSNPATENDDDEQLSKEEENVLPKQEETKSNQKKASTGNEEMMEDSPIMGVLTPKSAVGTQGSSLSESNIKKAILERADHFQANSEKISLAGVRRLLEEDLGLDKKSLDAFKVFISQQVHELLQGAKSVKDMEKKGSENAKSKISNTVNSEEGSDTSLSGSGEMRDKVKSTKDAAHRRNIKKLEQPKKRKISNNADIDVSHKKQNKIAKRQKEEDNNSVEDESPSEDGQSQSSVERPPLRKENPAPGYGKRVENLKSIIKSCGMGVPPSIYKKVKQVSDNERETFLVKELEGILSREGLSKNPSEKEIKDCRKRKERAKELEGIDMSNIISSSRRRSSFGFVAQEKTEIRAKKDKVDSKGSTKKGNNDDIKEEVKEGEKEKEEDDEDEEEEKEKEKEKEDEDEEKEKEKEKEEGVEEEEDDEEEDDVEDEEEDDEDESEDFNEDDNGESD